MAQIPGYHAKSSQQGHGGNYHLWHGFKRVHFRKEKIPVSPVKTLIQQVKWQRVIMDEAHHIRNPYTSSFKGAVSLNRNITWLVTGTPIKNKTSDFYSLCSVLGLDESSYESLPAVQKTMKKYVLRRTKKCRYQTSTS